MIIPIVKMMYKTKAMNIVFRSILFTLSAAAVVCLSSARSSSYPLSPESDPSRAPGAAGFYFDAASLELDPGLASALKPSAPVSYMGKFASEYDAQREALMKKSHFKAAERSEHSDRFSHERSLDVNDMPPPDRGGRESGRDGGKAGPFRRETRIKVYLPPGRKLDVLSCTDEPRAKEDILMYAKSMAMGMAFQAPFALARNYVMKNYKNQVEYTQKLIARNYFSPSDYAGKYISQSVLKKKEPDYVRLNFFFMQSIMGVRLRY